MKTYTDKDLVQNTLVGWFSYDALQITPVR